MSKFDAIVLPFAEKWAEVFLRYSLGTIFAWFGILKIMGLSPAAELLAETYRNLPPEALLYFLGIIELLIGIGLFTKMFTRTTMSLMWLEMLGSLIGFLANPGLYFQGPLVFTLNGQSVFKNILLIGAGLVLVARTNKEKNNEI